MKWYAASIIMYTEFKDGIQENYFVWEMTFPKFSGRWSGKTKPFFKLRRTAEAQRRV